MKKEIKRRGIVCVVAAAGYAAALAGTEYWQLHGNARMLVFLIPYLLMVWETGRLLWKSLRKRKLFDENLLILLATVGAFFVHRYSEAVGAMLFFQIGKLVETFSMLRTHKSIEKFMDIRPQYANLKISGGEIQVPPGGTESQTDHHHQAGRADPGRCCRYTGNQYAGYKSSDRRGRAKAGADRKQDLQRKHQHQRSAGGESTESFCRLYGVPDH